MCIPALHVRHKCPLKAPSHRHPLPPVSGSPALRVLWVIRLPGGHRPSSFLVASAYRLALPPGFRVRPTVCRGFPHCVAQYPYPLPRRPCKLEPTGPPKFLTLLSTHPTLYVDPGRPSGISPKKRSLCIGFWRVNTIAICILLVTGLSQAWGSAVSPAGYVVPCVRFNCFVRLYIVASSTVATLGMSGWLDLAQWGLAPHKKRQASLGALTLHAHREPATPCLSGSPEPQPGRDAVARTVRLSL